MQGIKTKKGSIEWDEIVKMLIFLAVLIFLLVSIWLARDKLYLVFDKIKNMLRFGF